MNEASEITEKQLLCRHDALRYQAFLERFPRDGDYRLDLICCCAVCGLRFSFKGLPVGTGNESPAASTDGFIAHLPIAPGIGGVMVPKE